jgi:hypothetical protein
MRTRVLLAMIVAVGAALAQPAAQSESATASIGGLVRDALTGVPIPDARIVVSDPSDPSKRPVAVSADSAGRYEAKGLAGGKLQVSASAPFRLAGPRYNTAARNITLSSGQRLAAADLVLTPRPVISGTVTDENGEPVPSVIVYLVEREYVFGVLRYRFRDVAQTDENGQYLVVAGAPGRAYLLMVHPSTPSRVIPDAISRSPANPKLRRRTFPPTYYPGTDSLQSAQPIILGPGETREGMNFRVRRLPTYCVSGTQKSASGMQGMNFEIVEQEPGYVPGGVSAGITFRTTATDGRFRVCELHPGNYFLTAYSNPDGAGAPRSLVRAPVTITDKDIEAAIQALPEVAVRGEIVWDGDAPPETLRLTVKVLNTNRGWTPGGETAPENPAPASDPLQRGMTVPGQFAFNHLFEDEYVLDIGDLPDGAYLKDITHNGKSMLNEAFRAGSISTQGLRIVLARDGGRVAAKVADNDSNPLPDVAVVLWPQSSRTDEALASAMVVGRTDQNGEWSSPLLAPGKYYAIGAKTPVDKSPESINKLIGLRSKASEVQIPSGGAARLTLTPIAE